VRHNSRKQQFVRALAEYLAGTISVEHSIRLQQNNPHAKIWAKVRSATPLFGYPTVQEAAVVLSEFLGIKLLELKEAADEQIAK